MTRAQTIGVARLASVVGVLWLAGASIAEQPAPQPPTTQTAAPDPPADVVTRIPVAAPVPPPPPDPIWNNVLDHHHAYVHELDRLGTAGHAPDPGCGLGGFHFYADGGFDMVHSYFTHHAAFVVTRRTGPAASAPALVQSTNSVFALNFGPRVELEAVHDNGWGARLSWWGLDEGNHPPLTAGGNPAQFRTVSSVPVFGIPGFSSPGPVATQTGIFADQLLFTNGVRLNVWDFEALRDFRWEGWWLRASGGARYAELAQDYGAARFNSGTRTAGTTRFNLITDLDLVGSSRNFTGGGPTGALEVRRQLGTTRFAAYASARGSVLFGRTRTRSSQFTTENLQTTVGTRTTTTAFSTTLLASTAEDRTVPMIDCELGLDWVDAFGPVQLVVRGGLVNETWFGSGSSTTRDGDLGFVGLRFTAGLRY